MFKYIGFVECAVKEGVDYNWGKVTSRITINRELQPGLLGLEKFSHIIIVYHLNKSMFELSKHLVRRPQGRDDMPNVGIFSQRAKDRPNGIGITSVKLLSVNKNIITVQGLDAIDKTPILDIKPYYPKYDLQGCVTVPEWVNLLMADYF